MEPSVYKRYAEGRAQKSPVVQNCVRAFLVGGGISAFGQLLGDLYRVAGLPEDTAWAMTSVTLIFLSAFLTGLGVFDRAAAFAGGGTLVPITGFANAVAAPAVDAKSEGFVLGVGAKIFTIAGPVILYGTVAGVIYGIIYAVWRAAVGA